MTALVNDKTTVLVQGITGTAARHHTQLMLEYGTQVVAGARPGSGGERVNGVPVFDTPAEAVQETGAEAAILFVPALAMKQAAFEHCQ